MSLYFPMFVDLSKKHVLFIGAGKISARRLVNMYDFVGSVTVVAPDCDPVIQKLADAEYITYHRRRFDENDLEGVDIAVIATGHAGTDVRIAGMCRRKGILVNVASDESLCDFYFPGIARKDPLVVGITASGEDHKMAAEATAYFKKLLKDQR
ncbi:MAG: bifunctional precorrin-2 dehydrogenase/sirohydrochlorin ferrochelatase [Mogibacterium sp.]|nr:bifunctional precorrin-2 dehydrogenase/sirohydrochlorin ferrochelatase [Mogibacterium sp.]